MTTEREKPIGKELEEEPSDDEGFAATETSNTEDRDYLWEDGDPADRRRDPLRKN
jgi:hypothetical protein